MMFRPTESILGFSVTSVCAGSFLSIWFVVAQMTLSSPPAAAPPTSDNNSASVREQVHIKHVTDAEAHLHVLDHAYVAHTLKSLYVLNN